MRNKWIDKKLKENHASLWERMKESEACFCEKCTAHYYFLRLKIVSTSKAMYLIALLFLFSCSDATEPKEFTYYRLTQYDMNGQAETFSVKRTTDKGKDKHHDDDEDCEDEYDEHHKLKIPCTKVPIVILSFEVIRGKVDTIKFCTSIERNSSYVVIESSTDLITWEEYGKIESKFNGGGCYTYPM